MSSRPEGRPFVGRMTLVAAVIAAAFAVGCAPDPGPPSASPMVFPHVTQPPLGVRDTTYDPPREAPDLQLVDQDGQPFDLAALRGRPVFVYFGYTRCPDVCPYTLADLRSAIKLADIGAHVVFVTVDPARDDAATLKQYLHWYHPDFIGLTGDEAEIAEVARRWEVSYRRIDTDSAAGYSVAHTTETYLVDADGMLRHHLFYGASPELVAAALRDVAR